MMGAFTSLTSQEVLKLTLPPESIEALDDLTSKAAAYSEVNVNLQNMTFRISENFTMLSFSEGGDASILDHSSWGHFVNLSQISSIILHSERSLAKTRQGDMLPPSSCSPAAVG